MGTHFTQLFKCPCSVRLTGLLFGLFRPALLIDAVSVEAHPHPSFYLSFPSTLQVEFDLGTATDATQKEEN